MANTINKAARSKTKKKPILVLGWGNDGCEDVDRIAGALGYDEGLDCAKGRFADSTEVVTEIVNWLKNNEYAQTLYVGAHGLKDGLAPTTSRRDKLGYRQLSDVISANIPPKASPLTVVLGACESTVAAKLWNALDQRAVGLLIAFCDRPDSPTVQEVLTEFLLQGDILMPGSVEIDKELVYLEEGVTRLKKIHPDVAIHYKGSQEELVDVDTLPATGNRSILNLLASQGVVKPDSMLWEAALAASKMADIPEQEQKGLKAKKRRPIKVRTFGPRIKSR